MLETINLEVNKTVLEKALRVFGVIRVFDNPDVRSQVREYIEHEEVKKVIEQKIDGYFGKRWHHAVYRCEAYPLFEKALRLVMIECFYDEIARSCTFDGKKTVENMLNKASVDEQIKANKLKNEEKDDISDKKDEETPEISETSPETTAETTVVH